jgi:predicted dithiol-disulfide oxidoreductase (DUF899 family)
MTDSAIGVGLLRAAGTDARIPAVGTRARDALNADRRRLPMVEIEEPYVFDGPDGAATLLDLFDGRRQLIVQHFMFGPDWDVGCPSCTAVSLDNAIAPVEYNYRTKDELVDAGMGWVADTDEMPGISCFIRDGDRVFHTYSTFGRGTEMLGGSYYWLDLTTLGRQEEWEEPKGRTADARPATPDFSS